MTHTPEQLEALAKNRAATQFDSPTGNKRYQDNPAANKPWSIQNQIKRIAAREIVAGDKDAIKNILGPTTTVAALIAGNTLISASKGNMKAVALVMERIDGKVPQVNVNADLERLQGMSDDELKQYVADLDKQLERIANSEAEGASETGVAEQEAGGTEAQVAPPALEAPARPTDGSTEQQG